MRTDDPTQIGRYRIFGRLGAGGMGEVFLGRSPAGLSVAVKRMHSTIADDPDFRRRFAREALAASRVSGAFTAAVVDLDADAERPWLATVYVPGMSLQESVQAHGSMPTSSVASLGARLAEALEAIHRAGVIHRDLKPSNVLLAPDGPRVIDFGIASTGDSSWMTKSGGVLGSMGYIAPEKLLGQPVREAGDVFALGAVLAFTAIATNPFGQSTEEAMYRSVHEPPALDEVAQPLSGVLARCLTKDPDLRPGVAELVSALVALADPAERGHLQEGIDWLPPRHAEAVRERAHADRTTGPDAAAAAASAAPEQRSAPSRAAAKSSPASHTQPVFGPPARTRDTAQTAGDPSSPATIRRRSLLAGLAAVGVSATAFGIYTLVDEDAAAVGDRKPKNATLAKKPPVRPGTELWSLDTGGNVDSSPVIVDGILYIGSRNGRFFAVDAKTGREKWTFTAGAGVRSTPSVGDGIVVFSSEDKHMYGLDAETGKVSWKYSGDVYTSPVVSEGVAYFGSESGRVYALEVSTGTEKWTVGTIRKEIGAAPAVAGGHVYLPCADNKVYALDTDGSPVWDFATRGSIFSGPEVRDGVVYVGSDDANLYAIDAASGEKKWASPVQAQISGDPVATEDSVYFGSLDSYLYGVRAATGRLKWSYRTGDQVQSSPTYSDGVVYVGSVDSKFHAVDAETGKKRWTYTCQDWVLSSPTVFAGAVYFGSSDRKVRALKA